MPAATDPATEQERDPAPFEDDDYALHLVPPAARAVIASFDVFCREVRDIPFTVRDPGVAQAKLSWWQNEVQRCFDGHPTHPALQALAPHLSAYGIEREPLLAITEACRLDLTQARYFSFNELRRYCDLASGSREAVHARIFGQTQPQTSDYARATGVALQLTRILRDVGRDAQRSRIYLPADDLDRFHVPESEILAATHSDRFEQLMRFEVDRAQRLFDDALDLLPHADRRQQKPGLALISLHRALLRAIAAEDFRVLEQRIDLIPLHKFWLAWKMHALGRF